MDEVNKLRRKINTINYQLLELLNKRTSIIKEISQFKDKTGHDYFDPIRENEMLKKIMEHNQGPLPNELVKEIFNSIFNSTLQYMGVKHGKNLLIGSGHPQEFLTIHDMFGLSTGIPIIIAGPCAIESFECLHEVAEFLHQHHIMFLRGGAYKPRSSPYEFQGLRIEGLKILKEISRKFDLITITEVLDTRDVETVIKYSDVLQVGARNMHNFELLKEIGQTGRPVLLKRGMSAKIQELMFAAEYIALQGNRKIIICERGIRTFETKTRNTLDISCIPIIKKETVLPVIADLSHSLGRKDIINEVAKAVMAAGADGLMVEVHPQPELALSDSAQQLNLKEFNSLISVLGINESTINKVKSNTNNNYS